MTIDSQGLRTVRPWDAPADFRILFVGDSVTWSGTSVDDTKTFPHLTCVALEEHFKMSFTCGNAGVSAYGTDNMTARLRYKKFHNEDAIVVTLIYPDMLRGLTELHRNYFFSSSPKQPFPAIWEAGTFWLFRITYWLRHHSEVHRNDDDEEVATRSLENLFCELKSAQEEGRLVLVVLSPIAEELGDHASVFTQRALRLADEYGLRTLDMNAPVTDSLSTSAFVDDRHLDIQGHELYAGIIARTLMPEVRRKMQSQGMLAQGHGTAG